MKYKKNIMLIIIVSAFFILLLNIIPKLLSFLIEPAQSFTVVRDQLLNKDYKEALIIRDEEIVKVEEGKFVEKLKADEAKVAKGEKIMKISSQKEEKLVNEIENKDKELEKVLAENQVNIDSTENVLANGKIENVLKNLNGINNQEKLEEMNRIVSEALLEKAKISGELSKEGGKIKKILEEKKELQNQLNKNTQIIEAPTSGNISYRLDGYEEKYKGTELSAITKEMIENPKIKSGVVIGANSNNAKIIKNFTTYLAVVADAKIAREVQIGDEINAIIGNNSKISMKVENINKISKNEKIIVFSTNRMVTELSKYRKVNIGIIWWSETGLKVSNLAIKKEGDLSFVVKEKAGVREMIPVKVIKKTDEYSLVEGFDLKILEEKTSKLLIDVPVLQEYDKIILNPTINKDEAKRYNAMKLNEVEATEKVK